MNRAASRARWRRPSVILLGLAALLAIATTAAWLRPGRSVAGGRAMPDLQRPEVTDPFHAIAAAGSQATPSRELPKLDDLIARARPILAGGTSQQRRELMSGYAVDTVLSRLPAGEIADLTAAVAGDADPIVHDGFAAALSMAMVQGPPEGRDERWRAGVEASVDPRHPLPFRTALAKAMVTRAWFQLRLSRERPADYAPVPKPLLDAAAERIRPYVRAALAAPDALAERDAAAWHGTFLARFGSPDDVLLFLPVLQRIYPVPPRETAEQSLRRMNVEMVVREFGEDGLARLKHDSTAAAAAPAVAALEQRWGKIPLVR